jgi:hypothetical protein
VLLACRLFDDVLIVAYKFDVEHICIIHTASR